MKFMIGDLPVLFPYDRSAIARSSVEGNADAPRNLAFIQVSTSSLSLSILSLLTSL